MLRMTCDPHLAGPSGSGRRYSEHHFHSGRGAGGRVGRGRVVELCWGRVPMQGGCAGLMVLRV